jgi:hypothetical protein
MDLLFFTQESYDINRLFSIPATNDWRTICKYLIAISQKVLQELISPDSNPDLNQCTLCKGAMRKGVRGYLALIFHLKPSSQYCLRHLGLLLSSIFELILGSRRRNCFSLLCS